MDRKTSNTYLLLYALLLVFLVGLSYRMAIEPCRKLKEDIKTISCLGDTLQQLNSRLRNANLQHEKKASGNTLSGFAGLVDLCRRHNVSIIKNKPVEVKGKSDIKTILIVDLEGGYISLIKVLREIEQFLNVGKKISSTFSTSTDFATKKRRLILRVVFALPQNNSIEK